MDAKVQADEQSQEKQPAPGIRVGGTLPPAQQGPEEEAREHARQDIRRELNCILPKGLAEREGERAYRGSGDGHAE